MRAVELDETGPGPGPGSEPASAERRPRGRRRWWLPGAAVVAVGALLVGGQAWLNARHDAWEARFQRVPGVVPSLTDHPRVLWTVKGSTRWSSHQVGPYLLAGDVAEDGLSYTIRATDRLTGVAAWTVHHTLPSKAEAPEGAVRCRAVRDGRSALCDVSGFGDGVSLDGTVHARVVVLDTADGHVHDEWDADWSQWEVDGDRVLAASGTTTGGTERWDVRELRLDGSTAWTVQLPEVAHVPSTTYADGSQRSVPTGIDVAGPTVVASAGGHVWKVGPDGAHEIARAGLDDQVQLGRGGVVSIAHFVYTPVKEGGTTYMTAEETSSRLVTLDGRISTSHVDPITASVDDGSAPDVTFALSRDADGQRLVALDSRTGKQLWSESDGTGEVILLGGRACTAANSEVRCRDARTGEMVWRTPTTPTYPGLATDGHVVYALDGDDQDHPTATAFDLETGAASAPIDLPGTDSGITSYWPGDGMLQGSNDDGTELRVVR